MSLTGTAPAPMRDSGAMYFRWVHVGVAALAMVLTFPGRTQGLGLFTEPLLKSLHLDRESYAFMNLWATLLGSLFCIPCGWLLDRLGTRVVFLGVTSALGVTVLAMSRWTTGTWAYEITFYVPDWAGGPAINLVVMVDLFVFLVLTRGLGQSALSVISLALIGRAAGRRPGVAMGVFACVTAVGFIAAFRLVGSAAFRLAGREDEWREIWGGLGVAVFVLGLGAALLIRNRFLEADPAHPILKSTDEVSYTLGQALRCPTFWTFTITTSFLGLVLAGTSLFGESLMAERGLKESVMEYLGSNKVFINVAIVGIPFGLAANLLVGWLASRWPLGRLMALATALFGAALFVFPWVNAEGSGAANAEAQIYGYAAVMAAAGGGITVCFFTVYRRAFGPAHLGSIQGIAQFLTVIFSAVGPQVFASARTRLGTYTALFGVFAAIALVLAVVTWAVGMPAARASANVGNPPEQKTFD